MMKFWKKPSPEQESVEALKAAKRDLKKTEERAYEVREVVSNLRKLRVENNFGEKLEPLMFPRGRQI